MKIDLHMHTTHSYQGKVGKKTMSDSSIRMEDIPILARAAGLDGIVITDHMTLEAGGGEFLRVQSEYPDFLLLRGMEYHTDHSHILLFGIKDDSVCKIFGKYGPVQEAIDYVIAQGGIVVPSHPYQQGYSFEMCDHIFNLRGLTALEIENGQMPDPLNSKAKNAAMVLGLPGTGGSDAHSDFAIGRCYTQFEREIRSMDDLVAELKSGNFTAVNKSSK